MPKLILSNKDFKQMAYVGTTVPWTKTKGEIEGKVKVVEAEVVKEGV